MNRAVKTPRSEAPIPEIPTKAPMRSHPSAASSHEKSDNHHPNTGGPPQADLGDSIAVEKQSVNPYYDFQQSIVQMIFKRRIDSKSDLQELLNCFLQLNTPLHHRTIIKVFIDLLINMANHAPTTLSYVTDPSPPQIPKCPKNRLNTGHGEQSDIHLVIGSVKFQPRTFKNACKGFMRWPAQKGTTTHALVSHLHCRLV
uniref:Transcription repressor n=1 Tax=Kalanchoe fedtschenkoi TaxID=63787 RepID=A0A7N0VBB4_KALFE